MSPTTVPLFSLETAKASMLLALICVSVAAAAFEHFRRTTGKAHFGWWAAAWILFAAHLAASIGLTAMPDARFLQLVRLACAGTSALLLFWGSTFWFDKQRQSQELAGGIIGVVVLCAVVVLSRAHPAWAAVPIALLSAGAGAYTGILDLTQPKHRRRGGDVIAICFVLWGVQFVALPIFGVVPFVETVACLMSAALSLVIPAAFILEREIEISEEKFRAVLDAATDAIFLVDMTSLEILEANRSAQSLTKRPVTELAGRSFMELCPDLDPDTAKIGDRKRMIDAVFRPYSEFRILRAHGGSLLCEGETTVVKWQRRAVLQLAVREVGDRKKINQQLRRAEKLSSLGQLIAGVAHELNNPLAVVMGYAQLLSKQEALGDKVRNDMLKVLHESERAAKIVRNLLTFARPAEPHLAVVGFNQLVSRLLETHDDALHAANIRLVKRLAPALPLTKADEGQIEQVLTNLLTNAIQALAERPEPRVLEVTTEERGTFIRITIADNGPGIAQEHQGKIFDPFFTTKPQGKGTGLGLTISHSIMEEHHGKIWVQSEPGNGARFFIELPVLPCEAEPETEIVIDAAVTDPLAGERRLLIVDDEPGIVEVLKDLLGGIGYTVETAGNGADALKRVSANHYDLIISDLCMPEMDGPALYEGVRQQDARLADRIIFVTGDTVSAKSRAFLDSIGNRWLSKPFDISDIEEAVGTVLRDDVSTTGGV